MKEIKVTKNDSGQRIDRFLSKSFPLGQGQICKLARKNCIKLNGKKCKPDTHIAENDIIKLFIPDEMLIPKAKSNPDDFTGVSDKIDIVYEDENILLVDKRPGLAVLRRSRMPAVLIETGFIDNDADNLKFDEEFEEIAAAISNGILETLKNEGQLPDSISSASYPPEISNNTRIPLRRLWIPITQ